MGWGSTHKCDVYFSKETIETLNDVELAIEDCDKNIQTIRETILMYSSGNINDIVPKEWDEEKIEFIKIRIGNLFEELWENQDKLSKLYIVKQKLEYDRAGII